MKIVVIGAGIMGLASAFELLQDGHEVTVLEAASAPGGLAGSFDFDGIQAEKFYHFICGSDRAYFRWLRRLDLADRLRWRRTSMGMFYDGRLHPFGDPLSLLRFSPLSMAARVRYGLHVLSARRRTDWKPLEDVPAKEWLLEGEGEEPYRVIWEPLLRSKFGEETERISAAWIWSRIRRLGSSRRGFFQEWLGFVAGGGSQVIVDALTRAVRSQKGDVRCATPVDQIYLDEGRVVGVRAAGKDYPADALLSTIPLPILAEMGKDLPPDYRRMATDLGNIGVRCIILKTREPLTPYFWINANDDGLPIVGLIEYTNLNSPKAFGGASLIYSPHYVSSKSDEYRRPEDEVYEETLEAMEAIRPGFDRSSVLGYRVFRAPYAQPVCPVGFTRRLAPLRTPVPNLVAGDTSHLLPDDRSISDSLALAERLTAAMREVAAERDGKG
jgi:protoporphyrinogen oxidase